MLDNWQRLLCRFFICFIILYFIENILFCLSLYSRELVHVAVEVEEDIYSYTPANNGASPQWNSGSTNIVRVGNVVYVSGLETDFSARPLSNVRCTLWSREASGWSLLLRDPLGLTREPCPLVTLPSRNLIFLSSNPVVSSGMTGEKVEVAPMVQEYSLEKYSSDLVLPAIEAPGWQRGDAPFFSEHSYRSFAADNERGDIILFQNIGFTHAEWTLRSSDGHWKKQGHLQWPQDSYKDKPQPVRVCYPNVAIKNNEVHFVGVSDIVEPDERFAQYKKEQDSYRNSYVYRRLFYAWNPDIYNSDFREWVEISNVDDTAGTIRPGDLWLDEHGQAYIVWLENFIDVNLRGHFFPEKKQKYSLGFAVVQQGKIILKKNIIVTEEGGAGCIPHVPRIHVLPDGRIYIFCYCTGTQSNGKKISENRFFEVSRDGNILNTVRINFSNPFMSYFTATERCGSQRSFVVDILGTSPYISNTVRYARVRIE